MSEIGETSIHEIRRRAPLHYLAKAENARFIASILWSTRDKSEITAARRVGYSGDPAIAKIESYYREASLSLELIAKAAVAARIQAGNSSTPLTSVPLTHNLPELWRAAELPKLKREDQHRLLIAKVTLLWSGRYAAPKTDEQFERERAELRKFEDTERFGKLKATRPRSFSWDDVDKIYLIAATEVGHLLS